MSPEVASDGPPTGGSRRPSSPGSATGDSVLGVAAGLFRRKGYGAGSTRELAELLGINKATLYHHIRGKEDLLLRICRESLARITEAVAEAARCAPPETRLRDMIYAHLTHALDDQDMHMVMLTELRVLSPDSLNEVIELRTRYEDMLRQAIAADQKEGRLRADIDAKYLTLALLNLLNWTIFWHRPTGEHSVEDFCRWLTAIFLDGARNGAEHSSPIALAAAQREIYTSS